MGQANHTNAEYLLSYGLVGDFGRFRALQPLTCRRGDRAVVQSHRGLEIAEILREATPQHAHFLPNTSVGQLVRLATPEDERTEKQMRQRAQELLSKGAEVLGQLALPMMFLDAEVLLDGEHGVLHHLCWESCDVRPLVSTLSRTFHLHIALTDLSNSGQRGKQEEEHNGCGQDQCGSGNCGSCSSGGCGTCGTANNPTSDEMRDHFARLRQAMEKQTGMPLL